MIYKFRSAENDAFLEVEKDKNTNTVNITLTDNSEITEFWLSSFEIEKLRDALYEISKQIEFINIKPNNN